VKRPFVTVKRSLAGHRWARHIFRGLPVRIARFWLHKDRPELARSALGFASRIYPDAQDLTLLQITIARKIGDTATERALVQSLLPALDQAVEDKANDQIVALLIEFEAAQVDMSLKAAEYLAVTLRSEARRKALHQSLAAHQESLFATQMTAIIAAMNGHYKEASAKVSDQMRALDAAPQTPELRTRMAVLRETWSTIDRIAFAHVDWADGDEPPETALLEDTAEAPSPEDAFTASKLLREQLLQGREQEKFLGLCLDEFSAAQSLGARLRALRQMVRKGLRRLPDYSDAYAQARSCLDGMQDEIDAYLNVPVPDQLKARHVALLNEVFGLSLTLRDDALAQRLRRHFVALSRAPRAGQTLWVLAARMATDPNSRSMAHDIMNRLGGLTPKTEAQVRDYLRWANVSGAYALAQGFVERVPGPFRHSIAMLQYVETLQRLGKFTEALDLAQQIFATYLSRPWDVRAMQCHKLFVREGELRFLRRTASVLGKVPQPRNPDGVIFILARNTSQLRSYPLAALREFRARNWAVISLVEGLLPLAKTGIPELDLLQGAISRNATLTPKAAAMMPELADFVADLPAGKVRWGDIDLSHALWEDAAINRRRYTIHWTCPELQRFLEQLCEWSRSVCRVLDYARAQAQHKTQKMGFISLFGHRLPDCLPRYYCQAKGDPEHFFNLHAANGYQNYFTNFSTNISERFVLRNTTRHPGARSASLPVPENFDRYFHENRHKAPEFLTHYQDVTRVRRSTGTQITRPPEAIEAAQRIADWRANGGKVACAFGKVVCDSGVPVDGGPIHRNMQDWVNHCVQIVADTRTLLLIKPHPHEMNNQIATFPTEFFTDLVTQPMGANVMVLGHRWFDLFDTAEMIDLGLVYNGTTTVELGLLGVPCLLSGYFAPIDYPIGQIEAKDRAEFESYLRFEKPAIPAPDIRERAAVWLHYMNSPDFALPYRFHARPVTNMKIYPPYWFEEDVKAWAEGTIPSPQRLVDRALGLDTEPGGQPTPPTGLAR
jgi:hypothetical protein